MIDKQFIVERNGKSFVLYAGLLSAAHDQGLKRITTKLLQVPSVDNAQTAIVSAEVETAKAQLDASVERLSSQIVESLSRKRAA